MPSVGTVQLLQVYEENETGYLLGDQQNHVLLPKEQVDKQLSLGEYINVFIYHDRNNEIVATTNIPSIQMNTYDWAEVVEVIPHLGVFVDIGIEKDILVSIDDLPLIFDVWPKAGDQLYVTLGNDQDGRLLAIPAQDKVFMEMRELANDDLRNQQVTGRVYYTSREGTAIFTDDHLRGFIHHTEREQEPRLGSVVRGRVIDVKDDGTINVSLLPLKHERIDDDAELILAELEKNNGVIPFSDKSDPETIRNTFGMSKSAFKRALGRLMREGKIEQRDGKTYLI